MIFRPSAPHHYQVSLHLLHFQLNFFSTNSSSPQRPTRQELTQGSSGTRESTIQTDDSLDCHHCRWIAKIWGEPLITTSGRSLFTYRLALYIQQLDDYILRYCGRHTAQLVGSALHGIPTTLTGPLLQLINVYIRHYPEIDCQPPLVHHMALPQHLHHSSHPPLHFQGCI